MKRSKWQSALFLIHNLIYKKAEVEEERCREETGRNEGRCESIRWKILLSNIQLVCLAVEFQIERLKADISAHTSIHYLNLNSFSSLLQSLYIYVLCGTTGPASVWLLVDGNMKTHCTLHTNGYGCVAAHDATTIDADVVLMNLHKSSFARRASTIEDGERQLQLKLKWKNK